MRACCALHACWVREQGWADLIKPNIGDGMDAAWDAAENLDTEEDMAAYLEAVSDVGDPALISAALGDIARAKGMTRIPRDSCVGRASLYKALSPDGSLEFTTILKVIDALGLKLHASTAIV